MSKTYVIAGTYHEAQTWIAKNYQERVAIGDKQASTRDYFYVSKAQDLVGIQDPHGVFVGTWRGRPDILEIVLEIVLRSTHANAALEKIYKDLRTNI
jgi:rRNA pseudouridine-1189 N-methylase Emg1 (Nep1/Mra1 family)